MNKQTSMKIDLELSGDFFEAAARLNLGGICEKEISFILNSDLDILSVTDGEDVSVPYIKNGELIPVFRALSQKILVKRDEPFSEICIRYRGSVQFDEEKKQNWHNAVTEDFVSLNWYSVWFPEDISVDIESDYVFVKNGHKWTVVKAEYDGINDVWVYGNKGFDPFNIVAYTKEKLSITENPFMKVFFIDESIEEAARGCADIYCEIINFYNNVLFERKDIPKLDVVCAYPYITSGGAYKRKDLMWCVSPGSDSLKQARLFAHETAHIWCCGADCSSWEDWLNETTAEWSALLFALYKKDDALFEEIIRPAVDSAPGLPPIKTADGSRPDGVHEKGTALFYKVYKKYGYETMVRMLQCFDRLKNRNTEEFIAALRAMGLGYAADTLCEEIYK